MASSNDVVHRICPTSTDSQTRLVCGVPLFSLATMRTRRASKRWVDVTCPGCLRSRPTKGEAAAKGAIRLHYRYLMAGITPRIACGRCPSAEYTGAWSSDPADVTCGRCLRSVAMASLHGKGAQQ